MKSIIIILTVLFLFCCSKKTIKYEEPINTYEMQKVIAWYYAKDKTTIPYNVAAILEGEAMGTVEEYTNHVTATGIYLYSSGYFVFTGRIDTIIYIIENTEADTLRDVDGIIFKDNEIIIRAEEELNLEAMYPHHVYIHASKN